MADNTDLALRALLTEVLALAPGQAASFTANTGLFGHIPELDSMAVASLLDALEERFAIRIDDDAVDAALFATYGALHAFVAASITAQHAG